MTFDCVAKERKAKKMVKVNRRDFLLTFTVMLSFGLNFDIVHNKKMIFKSRDKNKQKQYITL